MSEAWQRLYRCDSCTLKYRAERDGAASRTCICGGELLRDTDDLIKEWLAGNETLDELEPRIAELLRSRGIPAS